MDEVTDERILAAARDEQLYLYNGRLWFNGNTYQVPRRRVQALRAAGLVRLESLAQPGRRRWLLTERGERLLAHGNP